MSSYVLTCCSSADLPKEYFEKNNIPYDEFYKRIAAGSMSSGISVTCNSALNAKKELLEKYLDRTIKVVDTLAASSGYGLFLDKPAEMRDADKSLEELYLFAEDNKLKRQSRN